MTDLLINIIGAACIGHLGADFLSQFDRLPDKPWKCNMCLTFWITILPFSAMYGFHALPMTAISALISEWIYKHV